MRNEADLIVVGGGVAGLYAALCAAPDADVLLLSSGPLSIGCNSRMASRTRIVMNHAVLYVTPSIRCI